MNTPTPGLKDDLELLDLMLHDSENQPALYQAGPYWAAIARNAAKEIARKGIGSFRGSENNIGMSFADNLVLDVRGLFHQNLKRRLARWATMIYPLNQVYEAQVRLTEFHAKASMLYAQELLNLKDRPKSLLKKYRIPESLIGGCQMKAEIDGRDYSVHYLSLLAQHDSMASRIQFNKARSLFEIGGGFGGNVHLLLENYKNIRKILYLDIPPNLYIGTQYLRAFYGAAVKDYRALAKSDRMQFSADESLEILCVAPWQIERFASAIDIFVNSRSFVEMPRSVVKNYADHFSRFPGSADSAVALMTYDGFDPNTTIVPDDLPKFFEGRKFDHFEVETLLDSSRKDIFFVSPGKLSPP